MNLLFRDLDRDSGADIEPEGFSLKGARRVRQKVSSSFTRYALPAHFCFPLLLTLNAPSMPQTRSTRADRNALAKEGGRAASTIKGDATAVNALVKVVDTSAR